MYRKITGYVFSRFWYLKRKFFYPSPHTPNSKTGNRPSSWRVLRNVTGSSPEPTRYILSSLFILHHTSCLSCSVNQFFAQVKSGMGKRVFFCWWRNHYKKRNAPNPPVKNTASSSSTLSRIMTFHDVYTPPFTTSLPTPLLVKSADRSGRNKRSPDYTDYVFKWCYNGGCGF